MIWDKITLETDTGELVEGVAPLIITASRATDIPAFYGEWFRRRLEAGYICWVNPFSGKLLYVSLEKLRLIVFWTKHCPDAFLPLLESLEVRGVGFYFQYTLNDYEREGLEPGVPEIGERIDSFRRLSGKFGRERTIWRFDPLILGQELSIDDLCRRISRVGEALHPYTERLVISFADIEKYEKVRRNISKKGFSFREWTEDDQRCMADGIRRLNARWNLAVSTCCEPVDLTESGILHGKCVDDELITRLSPSMKNFFALPATRKDPGQRKQCGCVPAKDIGQYNTCPHLCVYCYANSSPEMVKKKLSAHDTRRDTISGAVGKLPDRGTQVTQL